MSLTYLDFLAVFLLVPLSVLCLGTVVYGPRERPALSVRVGGIAVIIVLALAYTIPWDNYLIAEGVWWYGDGRVTATVWLAPIEEYLFIVLQSVLVAVWTFQLAGPVDDTVGHTWRDRGLGAFAGLLVAAVGGASLLAGGPTYYLGAILLWAGPVFALQWAVGWRYLLRVRRRVLAAVGVPVVYLCAIDRVAIAGGIWTISPDHTTGLAVAGLPIEEATFFLVTSTFVVQGLVLLRWVIARWG
jgi:lycopene cyclase domain-containing protein